MNKRILSVLLSALMLLSLAACGGTDTPAPDAADVAEVSAEEGTEDAAAPAEEAPTEEAAAVEEAPAAEEPAEEAAPVKRDSYDYIDFFEAKDGGHSPYSLLAEGSTAGIHIKVDQGGFLEDISVACPSWSNNIGSLTFRLYKWDTDFATSAAGTPVAEQTFVDYGDNDVLMFELYTDTSRGAEAGEYLFWMGDGVDESGSGVGFWGMAPIDDGAVLEYFYNGESTTDAIPEGSMTIVYPAE